MTIRQFVAICIRLFAVWLFMGAVGLAMTAMKSTRDELPMNTASAFYMVGFILSASVALWLGARFLAGFVVSGLAPTGHIGLLRKDLIVAGCVVLALLWLKEGLLGAVELWLRAIILSARNGDSAFSYALHMEGDRLAHYAMDIAVAVVILYRTSRITDFLLRHADNEIERPADIGAES